MVRGHAAPCVSVRGFPTTFRHFCLPEQCLVRRLERNEVCLDRATFASTVLYFVFLCRLYAKCYNCKFVVLQSINFLVIKCLTLHPLFLLDMCHTYLTHAVHDSREKRAYCSVANDGREG